MFGMGFMEIFLVVMVAIVALGPDKLPSAVVDIAKFFKKFKSGIDDAKATLDNELNISEMRAQANDLKATMKDATNSARIDINSINSDIMLADKPKEKKKKEEPKIKKSKKEKISLNTKEV